MAFPHDGKKFEPGESGNPAGRPKKLPALDVLIEKVLGEEKDGITAAEAILMKLRQQAAGGNIKASDILLDRAFGKAKQSHDLNVSGAIGIIWNEVRTYEEKEKKDLPPSE